MQFVLLGELMAPEFKVLSGLITSFGAISIFATTKLLPNLLTWIQGYGTYWLFASVALSSNILYLFFIPETKGKTMLEIKRNFEKEIFSTAKQIVNLTRVSINIVETFHEINW